MKNKQAYKYKSGFTLVELSIVLVIIGLIVGGVVGGQSLVHQSRLMRVLKDAEKYKTAILTFQDKYEYLPGDLPTATSYWGANASCPNGTGTGTCNGDGDSAIGTNEVFRTWQHLSNSGILPEQYTGTSSTYAILDYPGVVTPRGSISNNSRFSFPCCQTVSNWLSFWKVTSTESWKSSLSATDAKSIDIKADDGKPSSGNLKGYAGQNNVGSVACVVSSEYNISVSGDICYPNFFISD